MSATDPTKTDDVLNYAAAFLPRAALGAASVQHTESIESPAVRSIGAGAEFSAGEVGIIEPDQPKSRPARISKASAAAITAKSARTEAWPREFRACRSRTITLKHDDRSAARVEVRWRSSHGFAVMAVKLGIVARGENQDRALGALIKLLDPEVEAVCDERGARLT